MLDVLVIALFVLLGAGNAAPAETLTNGVAIDGPVRLSLTDDLTAPGLEALLSDEELRAERPLSWVLYKGSSVGRSVVYLGPTNSFRFRLTTLDAVVLPMTDYGKAITIGPRSLTKLSKNPDVLTYGSSRISGFCLKPPPGRRNGGAERNRGMGCGSG